MYQPTTIAKALVKLAQIEGADTAAMTLKALASERQNTNLVFAVSQELSKLASKETSTDEITIIHSAADTNLDTRQKQALDLFGVTPGQDTVKVKATDDNNTGGLVLDSVTKRLDLSVSRQLQKLAHHLR